MVLSPGHGLLSRENTCQPGILLQQGCEMELLHYYLVRRSGEKSTSVIREANYMTSLYLEILLTIPTK